MLKKMIIGLTAFVALATTSAALVPQAALAVDVLQPACNLDNRPAVCRDNLSRSGSNPVYGRDSILARAIQFLAIIIGVGAVVVVIISGFKFITSQGDPSSVSTARQSLLYALIGLVVAAVAQSIVSFVLSRF